MAIKNRNIAADAKIDLSKINLVTGKRTFYEDFDDTTEAGGALNLDASAIYGFDKAVKNTPTCIVQRDSTVLLDSDADGDVIMLYQTSDWSVSKEPEMAVRIKDIESLDNCILQFGWTEGNDAFAAPDANAVAGDKDKAYVEFRGTGGSFEDDWVLYTQNNSAAGAETGVSFGFGAATGTAYEIRVKLTSGGGVHASVDNTTRYASSAAVPKTLTDMRPFVRVNANGAAASLKLDTFFVSENRS